MLEALVTITIVGVVLVLAVLLAYLGTILHGLREIGVTLDKVSFGVRAIEQETATFSRSTVRINGDLDGLIERKG